MLLLFLLGTIHINWFSKFDPHEVDLQFQLDRDDVLTVNVNRNDKIDISYKPTSHIMRDDELKKSRKKLNALQKWHDNMSHSTSDNFWQDGDDDAQSDSNSDVEFIEIDKPPDHPLVHLDSEESESSSDEEDNQSQVY